MKKIDNVIAYFFMMGASAFLVAMSVAILRGY